jgi:hypothetical protein
MKRILAIATVAALNLLALVPTKAGIFNDNNGAITATGNYLAILAPDAPTVVNTAAGGGVQLIKQISWYFITDGSAAGSIAFQYYDANGTWRAFPTSGGSAPTITLAASTAYYGGFVGLVHGVRIVATLSAGTILYGELMGASNEAE